MNFNSKRMKVLLSLVNTMSHENFPFQCSEQRWPSPLVTGDCCVYQSSDSMTGFSPSNTAVCTGGGGGGEEEFVPVLFSHMVLITLKF